MGKTTQNNESTCRRTDVTEIVPELNGVSNGLPPPLLPPESCEPDVLVVDAVVDVLELEKVSEMDVMLEVSEATEVGIELEGDSEVLALLGLLGLLVLPATEVLIEVVVRVASVVVSEEVEVEDAVSAIMVVDSAGIVAAGVVAAALLSLQRKSTTSPTKSFPIKESPDACSPEHNRCTNLCAASRLDWQSLEHVPVPPIPWKSFRSQLPTDVL